MTMNRSLSLLRVGVGIVGGSALVPLAVIAGRSLGLSSPLGLVVAVLLWAVILAIAVPYLPARLEPATVRTRCLFAVWCVLCGYGSYRVAHLGAFMLDVRKTSHALNPVPRPVGDPEAEKPFFLEHCCFTCYVVGAHLAGLDNENIYDPSNYRDPVVETEIHRQIGEFLHVDRYQYPPPFLLLTATMEWVGLTFYQMRALWYVLTLLLFSLACIVVARLAGGREFNSLWFTWPLVIAAPTTQTSLQIGNAHFLIVCIAVLSWAAFLGGRRLLGGALLGFAIVSKIFPGLLLAYLLARRRFRDALVTMVCVAGWCAAAWLVFGAAPWISFVEYQLPRIASGEAFSFAWESVRPMIVNLSVFGAPFKLHRLGLLNGWDPKAVATILNWAYTVLLAAILLRVFFRRTISSSDQSAHNCQRLLPHALEWLAVLLLAQLRSPFLPWDYGANAVLWLLALLMAACGRIRHLVPLAAAWAIYACHLPLSFGPPTVTLDLAYGLAALALAITLSLCLLLRKKSCPVTLAPDGR